MSALSPVSRTLIDLMASAPRGPRREGLFALWLTTRLIEDLGHPSADRIMRRRVALLEKRLSSLGLSQTMKKGLSTTLRLLKEAVRPDPATLLSQLAAPAKDGVGPDAAEILNRAARALR